MSLNPVIPLAVSCTAGYSNTPCSPKKTPPPDPPANPTQDYYPQGKLDLEALPALREQLRRSLGMQVN